MRHQKTGIERGILFARVGVQFTAYVLNAGKDMIRLSARGSFEKEMLDKMREAFLVGSFIA